MSHDETRDSVERLADALQEYDRRKLVEHLVLGLAATRSDVTEEPWSGTYVLRIGMRLDRDGFRLSRDKVGFQDHIRQMLHAEVEKALAKVRQDTGEART